MEIKHARVQIQHLQVAEWTVLVHRRNPVASTAGGLLLERVVFLAVVVFNHARVQIQHLRAAVQTALGLQPSLVTRRRVP
jgi:hypothetical protein